LNWVQPQENGNITTFHLIKRAGDKAHEKEKGKFFTAHGSERSQRF
jgi:hypothetical protein